MEKASEAGWDTTSAGYRELKAAPIPSVNIWQQRKLAQDAKLKANIKITSASLSLVNNAKPRSPTLPATSDDPTPDQAKAGNKKRGSVPTKTTDEASTLQRQDRRRPGDGAKPRDEGMDCLP